MSGGVLYVVEMTSAERDAARLLKAIKEAGAPVPDGATFRRTYAGRHQRSEGGAIWVLVGPDGLDTQPLVCSQWPRAYLLRTGVDAWLEYGTGDWIVAPAQLL